MESLKGKVFIVTGASSGIGLVTVNGLLGHGAKVFGCDISDEPTALSPAENFGFLQCNLTKPEAPAEVVGACKKAFGGLDGLLNVAGIMDSFNTVDTLTDEMWDRLIAVNLTAPVKLMRAAIPLMLERGGGSIVNVASKAATSGASAGVAYTASKHGLVGATTNTAWRFHKEGIRCNAVCPGGVTTNISESIDQSTFDQKAFGMFRPVSLLNVGEDGSGIAPPEKIANVLIFLASDMSSEINGAIIPVDHAFSTI